MEEKHGTAVPIEQMWDELEKDEENGRIFKLIRKSADLEIRLGNLKEKIFEELQENVDCYFEIRQCNSPHTQHDYIWFNEIRFRKFLETL